MSFKKKGKILIDDKAEEKILLEGEKEGKRENEKTKEKER